MSTMLAMLPVAHAAAQTYTPQAIVPTPDVYSFLAQNPILTGIYSHAVKGQFSHLYVFGNSYADWGNSAAGGYSPGTSTNRFGNALSMGDGLEYTFGLQTSQVSNYAVGGAYSGLGSVIPFANLVDTTGTESQINAFIAASGHFAPSQLVDITTFGGNDIFFVTSLGMAGAVSETVAAEQADVRLLAAAGARTITITSGSDTSVLPATAPGGLLNSFGIDAGVGSTYHAAAFTAEQQFLASYNRSPTRIFFLDLGTLEQRMVANPALFGFTDVADACTNVSSCANGSLAVQDGYMTYDGLHLSTLGFAWVARYQSNQVLAPSTIAAQSNLALATARSFTGSIFNRLDATAGEAMTMRSGNSPVSLFMQGGTASGSLPDQQYAFGIAYDIPSVSIGGEYRVNDNLDLGLEANYSHPHAGIDQGEGSLNLNSYQFAGYAHYHPRRWFADVIASGGTSNYAITRTGVLNSISASTQGASLAMAFRAGWNAYEAAGFRLAPVAGLDYTRISENGYTETGDYLLDQTVSAQTMHSLVVNAGLEAHYRLTSGPADLELFGTFLVNTTLGDNGHNVVTAQASTPGIQVLTVVPGAGHVVYEEASAGLSGALTPRLLASASLGGMFGAHTTGSNIGFTANVTYKF